MPTPPADSANEPAELHSIRCPYCDQKFDISLRTVDGTRLPVEKAELQALPYARDVEIFDPDPHAEGKTNSQWTKIGEDFFGGLNYESIGILHMEKGWQVHYCVARCPHCARLIDVFANLTQGKTLAEMWPHLLGKSPDGRIKPWRPKGTFSSWSEDTFFVLLFFLLIGAGSLIPDFMPYLQQPVFDSERFRMEMAPICWLRGTMAVSLFLLFSIRKKLIDLFRNTDDLSRLFDIKTGLAYWSNFAVSRFTGYQKANHLFTINAVMLLGGVSSVIIFTTVSLIVRFGVTAPSASTPYAAATGLLFWTIIAYLFGIIVWNFSVVPVYVFRGMRNIPMQVDIDGDIREFKIIKRAARYCVVGLGIIIVSAIALSLFPMFTEPFAELRSAIIWAQFALIVCFSVLIIRFEIKAAKERAWQIKGSVKIGLILLAYILLRYGIGLAQPDGALIETIAWLGIADISAAKSYAELVVFSFLAAYLSYRLTRDIVLGQIKESTRYNIFRYYDNAAAKARERKDYAAEASIRAAAPPASRRNWQEQTFARKLQWATVILGSRLDRQPEVRDMPAPQLENDLKRILQDQLEASPLTLYSCFISYSSKDEVFAKRLYADLQNSGVQCWFAPEDMKIGEKFRQGIDEAIHKHERLLLILSENSVSSEWVEKEVETAFEKEQQQKRTVLFPVHLDDTVMQSHCGWCADIRRTRQIGDFRNWKDKDAYQKAFTRVLRDLKAAPGNPSPGFS